LKIDSTLIDELKAVAASRNNTNVRLCLHKDPDAAFHEMINLEHAGKYYKPHKHPSKGESYHIIEGSMAFFVFGQDGEVLDANILDAKNSFMYRVDLDTYHALIPLSDLLIYHESKPGPFIREGDSLFPDWAPNDTDPESSKQYTRELLGHLDIAKLNEVPGFNLE